MCSGFTGGTARSRSLLSDNNHRCVETGSYGMQRQLLLLFILSVRCVHSEDETGTCESRKNTCDSEELKKKKKKKKKKKNNNSNNNSNNKQITPQKTKQNK